MTNQLPVVLALVIIGAAVLLGLLTVLGIVAPLPGCQPVATYYNGCG